MPPWASRWGGVEGQWGTALAPRSIVIERIAVERAAELLRTVNDTTASRSASSQSGGALGWLGWAGDAGEGGRVILEHSYIQCVARLHMVQLTYGMICFTVYTET